MPFDKELASCFKKVQDILAQDSTAHTGLHRLRCDGRLLVPILTLLVRASSEGSRFETACPAATTTTTTTTATARAASDRTILPAFLALQLLQ